MPERREILQADYNTLMAAAKKDYESTLKKPKSSGVKVSAGERQEDRAHAAMLALETELRTLENTPVRMRKSASSAVIYGKRKIRCGPERGRHETAVIRAGKIAAGP